jgi:hypothetical protein
MWQVFEVAPSLFMVEVRKAVGDTLEYHKVYPARQHRTVFQCSNKVVCTVDEFVVGFLLSC